MPRVYVGGIPSDCRDKDLDRFFKNYGRIRDILIKNGYAFIEFDDSRDADDAVYEMNGRDLLGCRVSVEHARGVPRRGEAPPRRAPAWSDRYGPPTRTPYRIIVENLSTRISWQDLKDYMRKEADVTFADAHRHARNEGIVEFSTYSDMKRALDRLDDTELSGRRIKLIDDYRRSRSRSRRRSPRRSRSPRRRSYSDSRSRSRDRRSKSGSRDRRSRSKSKDSRRSRSRSGSRAGSADKAEGASNGHDDGKRSRSRSRDSKDRDSPSPKKARMSHSPSQGRRSASKGRSPSNERRSRSMERRSPSNERRSRSDDRRSNGRRSYSNDRSRSKSGSRSRSRD